MKFFTRRRVGLKIFIFIAVTTALVLARQDGAPPGYTGDFGEPNCTECHSSFAVDSGRDLGGTFDIVGVPDQYVPGQTYTIMLQLNQDGQQRWGFELATRFMNDASQAGEITITDLDNTQRMDFGGIEYITHTNNGTFPFSSGPIQWSFDWTAPDDGTVVFSAAGNAADNDSTSSGDYIYTTRKVTTPAANKGNQ